MSLLFQYNIQTPFGECPQINHQRAPGMGKGYLHPLRCSRSSKNERNDTEQIQDEYRLRPSGSQSFLIGQAFWFRCERPSSGGR